MLGMQARTARFNGDLRIRGGHHGTRVHAWMKVKGRDRASEDGKLIPEQARQRAKIVAEKSRITAQSIKSTISDIRDRLQLLSGRSRTNPWEF